MEIISALLLGVSPWLIKGITNLVKRVQSVKFSGDKVFILRFLVATLSFGAALGNATLNGTVVDDTVVSVFADAVVVFLGTTGVYFFDKVNEGKM